MFRFFLWLAVSALSMPSLLVLLPSPAHAQIETLDFFLPDDESVELVTASGTNPLSQQTQGNAAFKIKWRQPKKHEYYTWDKDWIYLRYDNTWGTHDGATSYEFRTTPGYGGKWMKRSMYVGESFTVNSSTGTRWYYPDCTVQGDHSLTYTNTLVAYYPSYNIGGDLGTDEVIVLKYDWGGGTSYERFFYARHWGWFRWESYQQGSLQSSVLFNHISSRTPVSPSAACVAFPSPCSRTNSGCTGTWSCSGRQCFTQPPGAGECQEGFNWCYGGCCCSCTH